MKLQRLHISRVPGIDEPFTVEAFGEGINVIVGPNGIGKSSLSRVVRQFLWGDEEAPRTTVAHATFTDGKKDWRVERDGARLHWQCDGVEADPPMLAPRHLQGCFFLELRDLLELSVSAGLDLAAQIRMQTAGGFDLNEVRNSLLRVAGSNCGRRERSKLSEVEVRIRQSEAGQEQLAQRAATLEDLRVELTAAQVARSGLGQVEKASELSVERADLAGVLNQLNALPKELAALSGTEVDLIEGREVEVEQTSGQLRDAKKSRDAALKALQDIQLDEIIEPNLIATWRARADGLADLEAQLEAAEIEQKSLQQKVRQALTYLKGAADRASEINLHSAADLFNFLRESQQIEQRLQAINERLALLGDRTFSGEDKRNLQLLKNAVEALRSWLRSPETFSGKGADNTRKKKIIYAVAVLLCVVGVVGVVGAVGFEGHRIFATLVGVGVGLVLSGWWLARQSSTAVNSGRTTAEQEFPSELEPPVNWRIGEVSQRLRSLETDLLDTESIEVLVRERQQDRQTLEARKEPVIEAQKKLESFRTGLAERLQLQDVPDAELVDMVRAIDQLRDTQANESAAGAKVAEIARRLDSGLNSLAAALGLYGLPAAEDSAMVKAQVAQLADLNTAFKQAKDQVEATDIEIIRRQEEINRQKEIVNDIYRGVGLEPGERVRLAQLIDQLEEFTELCRKRDVLKISVERIENNLTEQDAADLCELTSDELQAKKKELEDKVSQLEPLLGEIKEIEVEVRNVRSGHALEDTLAERDAALIALHERQGIAMRAEAARFLIDAIKEEHETTQMPRVLERARELFSIFTHHAYELMVAPDQAASFTAIEVRTGTGKAPDELSDGTRVQLLLAVRLAFAEDIEQGAILPIFLDEALDQSDPERFQAIVKSLGHIAEDSGRQIFYLTSDPGDAERIQVALKQEGCADAHLIDLAVVRQLGVSIKSPESLSIPAIPAVPLPAGQLHEQYAAKLGIPAFDPRRSAAWQHLYYIAWDDLDLLHRLLSDQIQHVGQWVTLAKNKAKLVRKIEDDYAVGAQLEARAALLNEFCCAWQEGRDRPVDWVVIEASGAVTPTFATAVAEIINDLRGDGRQLIDILESRSDSRLAGFRTRSTEALEKVLVDEGYIDKRRKLDESGVLTRTLSTPAAHVLPQNIVGECVHRWWSLSVRLNGDVCTLET